MFRRVTVMAAICVGTVAASASAATTVKGSGLHICCKKCVTGLKKAIKSVTGAKGTIEKNKGEVTITTADDKIAQQAIDAIATAGYHGTTNSKTVTFKDDSGVKDTTVQKLTVSGFHNCCGKCVKGLKKAVRSVKGAQAGQIGKGTKSFEVTGSFQGAALVKALNDGGYHVTVQ